MRGRTGRVQPRGTRGCRSGSDRGGDRAMSVGRGRGGRLALWLIPLLAAVIAAPATAGAIRLEPWRGHVSLGYGHLLSDDLSPGGSISVAGGVDYQINEALRV